MTPFASASSGHRHAAVSFAHPHLRSLAQPSQQLPSTGPTTRPSPATRPSTTATPRLTPKAITSPSSANWLPTPSSSSAYVGSQAHHLLVLTSANPGNPRCLSASAWAHSSADPFNEGLPPGGPFPSSFGAITYQKTIGFSNYNSFEATLRHTTKSLEVMAAYTYGKSLDDSSSLSEPVYPMGAALHQQGHLRLRPSPQLRRSAIATSCPSNV